MTKCFFVWKTDRADLFLRRYSFGPARGCLQPSGYMSYHNGMVYLRDVEVVQDEQGYWSVPDQDVPHSDARWPLKCDHCDYVFKEVDAWQEFTDRLYTDGTKSYRHRELPVGAMYYADWLPKNMFWDNKSDDYLTVVTPGGEWNIDQRASNCTLPEDRLHRCWVRHGEPPNVTVDKRGVTCSAGGGSIQQPRYHGFLQSGWLT